MQKQPVLIIIAGLIIGLGIAFLVPMGSDSTHSGGNPADAPAAYVREAFLAIGKDWNSQELIDRAHPALVEAAPKPKLEKFFKLYRRLGSVIDIGPCSGELPAQAVEGLGRIGEFTCPLKGANGVGQGMIRLISDDGKNLKILYFHVDSELFLDALSSE